MAHGFRQQARPWFNWDRVEYPATTFWSLPSLRMLSTIGNGLHREFYPLNLDPPHRRLDIHVADHLCITVNFVKDTKQQSFVVDWFERCNSSSIQRMTFAGGVRGKNWSLRDLALVDYPMCLAQNNCQLTAKSSCHMTCQHICLIEIANQWTAFASSSLAVWMIVEPKFVSTFFKNFFLVLDSKQ